MDGCSVSSLLVKVHFHSARERVTAWVLVDLPSFSPADLQAG